jgi:peptide chain release factor 1
MNQLLEKLALIADRHSEVGKLITDPGVIADQKRYTGLMREYRELEELVSAYENYRKTLSHLASAEEMLKTEQDPDMRELAEAEAEELKERKSALEEEIKVLLIPKDPEDYKNCIMEIRAGTGGDEAGIFAADLYRMYSKYFENKGWQQEVMNLTEGTLGGMKEIIFRVTGTEVYATLKFESGVHRVQRVPETESQGRIHTSAATVAVLPEAEEVDVVLNMTDIRKDTFRASGAGGQHVNKTESAIRLTHIPTGLVVECQDGRSQHQNYDRALTVLRTRLYEAELEKKNTERAQQRKTLVSTGDRSAKIRTYNYPQGRVTDHRIGLTLYNLSSIINGDLEDLIDALKLHENTEKLQAGQMA